VPPELLERLLDPLDACRALCMRAPRWCRDSQLVRFQRRTHGHGASLCHVCAPVHIHCTCRILTSYIKLRGLITMLAVPDCDDRPCEALCVYACWVMSCQLQRVHGQRTHCSTQQITTSIVVRSICRRCVFAVRSEGFAHSRLCSQMFGKTRGAQKHLPAAGSNSMTPADSERWLRLLHALQLGPVQREHLLTLRMRQLAKLAKLTDARRFLSMQVDMAQRGLAVPSVESIRAICTCLLHPKGLFGGDAVTHS